MAGKYQNELPSVAQIKEKAKMAGMQVPTYWREVVAPIIKTLPSMHARNLYRALAWDVSMNIIPYPTFESRYLPRLFKDIHSMPWDTIVETHGVNRKYAALATLRAVDRYFSREETAPIMAEKKATLLRTLERRDPDSQISPMNAIVGKCLGMGAFTSQEIATLLATNQFNITLGRCANMPATQFAKATGEWAATVRDQMEQLRNSRRKYAEGHTRGAWLYDLQRAINRRADEAADYLLASPAATDNTQSLLKTLNQHLKSVTVVARPRLPAVIAYAHKHIAPRLAANPDLQIRMSSELQHFTSQLTPDQQAWIAAAIPTHNK